MEKSILGIIIFIACSIQLLGQEIEIPPAFQPKTLLLEKIGTNRKHYYAEGDRIKLRTKKGDVIFDYISEVRDTVLAVGMYTPFSLKNIAVVWPQYEFARKFGTYMCIAGMAYFAIVTFDHLINNEQVFTRDMYIVPASLFGAGIISISLSQQRCKIGDRWKLKVLGMRILR
jgi:hypothetical protein